MTPTERKIIEQVIAALELMRRRPDICKDLRSILEQKDAEPVAWIDNLGNIRVVKSRYAVTPLYAHPAPSINQEYVERALHYPECWDTAAYPTVWDALSEVTGSFLCSNNDEMK